MPKVGDIIEQDGQKMKIVDIKEQTYEDGTKVEIVTTEPV